MIGPLFFFFGYKKLRIGSSYAGELMNICSRGGYVYRNFRFVGEHACFDASMTMSKKIISACQDRGIPIFTDRSCGIPAILARYRKRYGIFVGILAFCAILFLSRQVVWSIRIDGNERVSDSRILDDLRASGMSVGSVISELDTALIENRLLIISEDISWISINMKGTVANVEVREIEELPEKSRYDAASLVASRSGQIEWFEDVRGNIAVDIGDVVKEGDLLVGGLYDIEGGGIRYTQAKGKVFARTEHDFSFEIPLTYEKKVYTGRVKTEKYLIFFEKEIKIFENSGNSYGTCDTIDIVEYFELTEDVPLPVGIRTVKHLEYTVTQAERSAEDAMDLAYYRLRCAMESEVPDGLLVRKYISSQITDSAYILHCKASYIEDIALTKEIEIDGIFK